MELKKSNLGTWRWDEFPLENHRWFALLFFSFFLFAKISIVFHNLFCENILWKRSVVLQQLIAILEFIALRAPLLLLLFFFSSSFPFLSSIFLTFLFCSWLFELSSSPLLCFFSSYLCINIFSSSYFLIFLSISSHFLIFLFSHLFM